MQRQDARLRLNSESMQRYEQYLELALEWLGNRYGISEESARRVHLGVVEDPFPSHRGMVRRLCIPYLDASGAPQSLKFRCMHCDKCDGHPKYLGEEGSEPRLYGVKWLLDDNATTLYVTEGEMDCIVLSEEIGLPTIGYPGTGSWSSLFTRAVAPQDWERIVVVADGDDPGRNAAKKVAKELKAEIINLPEGEDVSSLYVKNPSRLKNLLGLDEVEDDLDGFDPGPEPEEDIPPF